MARERRRNFRRNYALFFIESVGYPLGFSIISSSTIIPLLLTQLGASNLVIGLAPAVGNLGVFVPGIFAAAYIERLRIKKKVFVTFAMVERALILAIAGIVMAWGIGNPQAAIIGFLVAWFLSSVAAGVNLPAYFAMLAKCIPPESRGGLFGISGAISGVVGVFVAEAVGIVLTRIPFPKGFALLFTTAFAVLSMSVLPLAFTAEPPDEHAGEGRSPMQYLRDAAEAARRDSHYAWSIAAIAILSIALTATSFYSTFAVRMLGATTRDVGRFTALTVGATVVGMPLLGRLADRRGHKLSLIITAGFFALAGMLAISASSLDAMYPVIFLASMGMSGITVSQNLLASEFAPTYAEVPMYVTFSWLVLAPFRAGAPVLAGYISDTFGFHTMFWITLAASMAAMIVLLLAVSEPRHRD